MNKYIITTLLIITLSSCKLLIGYKSDINYSKDEVLVKALKYDIPIDETYVKSSFPISRQYIGVDLYNSKGDLIYYPLFDSCSYTPINFIINLDSIADISVYYSKTHESYSINLAHFEKLTSSQSEKSIVDFNVIFYWSYKYYGPTKLYLRRLREAINQHPHLKFNVVYVNIDG